MAYAYLLFDWDGCLAKTLEVWLEAYMRQLAARGLRPEPGEVARHFGDWSLGKHFGVKDYEAFNLQAVEWARKKLARVSLYDGVGEMINDMSKDYRMALLSSAHRDLIQRGLDFNHLSADFELIISGEDVQNHKPHPEIIEAALQHFNAEPSQALMIGDTAKDIEAANNAGVDSVLVFPQSHRLFYDETEIMRSNPTYVLRKVTDLPTILH